MKNLLKIYKIGGGIIDNPQELISFLEEFTKITDPKILIHGGGKGANKILSKLGIEPKMVNGRRITDEKTLNVVISFYAGITNKQIVAQLQNLNCNAIGLSGADANVICGKKREIKEIDYGFVADLEINSINTEFIKLLLDNNLTPVFCAITHDKKGNLLNTNADTISSVIAQSLVNLYEIELHYCFDKIGVLEDVNDDNSIIKHINKDKYQKLIENNKIHDGMIPKLENAFIAINYGVKKVILEHSKNINSEIKTIID